MSPVPSGCSRETLRNVWRTKERNFRNDVSGLRSGGEFHTSFEVPVVKSNGWVVKLRDLGNYPVAASLSETARVWEDVRIYWQVHVSGEWSWDSPAVCLPSFPLAFYKSSRAFSVLRWRINSSQLPVEETFILTCPRDFWLPSQQAFGGSLYVCVREELCLFVYEYMACGIWMKLIHYVNPGCGVCVVFGESQKMMTWWHSNQSICLRNTAAYILLLLWL